MPETTIVNLEPEAAVTCADLTVTFTATTDPPDEVVTVSVDGGPPETVSSASPFQRRFNPGMHTLTVSIGNESRSASVRSFAVTTEILEPASGDRAAITAEPRMPTITARAVILGPGTVSAIEWSDIRTAFRSSDCFPFPSPDRNILFDFPPTSGEQVTFNFGDVVRGGFLGFRVRAAIDGIICEDSDGIGVDGTNPPRSDVEDALPHNTLRAIACRESFMRQFDAPPDGGMDFCPLFSSDGKGRVGVMQILDATDDEVWNWRLNVAKGIEIFNEKVAEAQEYPSKVRSNEEFNNLVSRFNQRRQQEGLSPIQVVLPEFTTGNFDDDLQQLELDAIRGYNGWEGRDRFGFELHEFRVALDARISFDPGTNESFQEEILAVGNIDEQALRGEAVWQRVPVADRPAGEGEPNYVESVLDFFAAGCAQAPAPPSCRVAIRAEPSERCFGGVPGPTGGGSLSGEASFVARLSSSLPPSSTVSWDPTHEKNEHGTFRIIDSSDPLRPVMRARHPGRVTLVARVTESGQDVCQQGEAKLSVPQFFHIVFKDDFIEDLERVGLRRRPANGSLTQEEAATNDAVRVAVINEAFRIAIWHYADINVRFTDSDPASIVGSKNFSTVEVGGPDPQDLAGGETFPNPGVHHDPYNSRADDHIRVYAAEFGDRASDPMQSPLYRDVFDGLAVEDQATGTPLGGTAVRPGDFVIGPINDSDPNAVRQRTVRAAVLVFGRLIGFTIAHECGHALGRLHTSGSDDLMSPGLSQSLTDRTGITKFDKQTGALVLGDPIRFGSQNLQELKKILPIFS